MKRRVMMGEKVDKDTFLLMHFDGDFTDSSIYNHKMTNQGCTFDSRNAKFGQSVIYATYQNEILPNEDLLSEIVKYDSFTIELWAYQVRGQNIYVISKSASGDINGVDFLISREGNIFFGNNSGTSYTRLMTDGVVMPERTWTHVAYVAEGNQHRIYVGGRLVKSGEITNRRLPNYDTVILGRVYRGADDNSPDNRMDELRISLVARYTSDFTPPTKPFKI